MNSTGYEPNAMRCKQGFLENQSSSGSSGSQAQSSAAQQAASMVPVPMQEDPALQESGPPTIQAPPAMSAGGDPTLGTPHKRELRVEIQELRQSLYQTEGNAQHSALIP